MIDTALIREYPGCPACADTILELCDALDAARILHRRRLAGCLHDRRPLPGAETAARGDAVKVGFTGSRNAPTQGQLDFVRDELRGLGATEFHHGDCIIQTSEPREYTHDEMYENGWADGVWTGAKRVLELLRRAEKAENQARHWQEKEEAARARYHEQGHYKHRALTAEGNFSSARTRAEEAEAERDRLAAELDITRARLARVKRVCDNVRPRSDADFYFRQIRDAIQEAPDA